MKGATGCTRGCGLVAGRGKVKGKDVIFTKLRSTYFHEVDPSAQEFAEDDGGVPFFAVEADHASGRAALADGRHPPRAALRTQSGRAGRHRGTNAARPSVSSWCSVRT